MDHPVAARRRRDYWPALGLFALAVYWPVAWLTWDWATLTGYYEESLGFRYFYSLRIVREPGHYLFLAQGHLATFAHELLQVCLDLFVPAVPLQPRVDIFARLAVVLGHGVTLCALAWALRPASFDGVRVPIAVFWALLYYVEGWDGYYVLLSPDYHTWIPAAGLLFTGLMARAVEDGGRLPAARYLQLGAFGAFAVGVKITLGAMAAVASAYFLLTDRPLAQARRRLLLAMLVGLLLAITILGLSYWGHFGHVHTYVFRFAQFLVSAGPIDVMTPARLQGLLDGGRAFGLIAIVALPLALLAWLALAKSLLERALPAALLLGALLYVQVAAKRFTPVTLFEAGVFLAAALSLAVALAARRWRRGRTAAAVAAATAVAFGASMGSLGATITNLHLNHAEQARLHAVLDAIPGPIAFLIPNNRYQFLSLEGALFKGTSDLASRSEVERSPTAGSLLGKREFLFGERARYEHRPPRLGDYDAVVFTVLYTGKAQLEGVAGIAPRVAELERNYNASLADFACRDWIDVGGRLTVVCRRGLNNGRVQ